jgi:hypothetical protein
MESEEIPQAVYALLGDIKPNSLQLAILERGWRGYSYEQIAQQLGYNPEYVKNIGSGLWRQLSGCLGLHVTKSNFRSVLKSRLAQAATESLPPATRALTKRTAATASYSLFVGRESELATLERWIACEGCSLVGVSGIGGMGKTTLCAQVTERLHSQRQYRVVWQTLRDAPPPRETLASLVRALGEQEQAAPPHSLAEQAAQIASLLSRERCLLVLDNFDSVLQSGETAGRFKQGFEGYGELLDQVSQMRGSWEV